MESGCSNAETSKTKKTKGTGTRCTWKPAEERALMEVLKELIAGGGWKSENGFKPGYLARLQLKLKDKLKDTNIKGNPHINSRITQWKRHHAALQTALAVTGSGFNSETMIIDVSDAAWEKAVQGELTVASMRFRPWPFYFDWLEVFGNDGATGGMSQTVTDAANELGSEDGQADESNPAPPSEANISPEEVDPCEMEVESQPPIVETCAQPVQPPTRKRSAQAIDVQNCGLLDGLAVLFKASDDRLDQIVHTLVVPPPTQMPPDPQPQTQSTCLSQTQVFSILDNIPDLELDQRLDAAEMITKNIQRLEMFSGLTDHARPRYVHRLLRGDFDKPV